MRYQQFPEPTDSQRVPVRIEDVEQGRVSFVVRDPDGAATSLGRARGMSFVRVNALCEGLLLHVMDSQARETTITVYLDER